MAFQGAADGNPGAVAGPMMPQELRCRCPSRAAGSPSRSWVQGAQPGAVGAIRGLCGAGGSARLCSAFSDA